MNPAAPSGLSRALLVAPLVFAAHVLEESPRLVPWLNAHVTPGITSGLFWSANATAFVLTVAATAAYAASRSPALLVLLTAWLSFVMPTNAAFHITAAFVDRGYVPGLVTAVCLYLPYSSWLVRQARRERPVAPAALVVAALLGAIPMAVHGYRILFLGTRLF